MTRGRAETRIAVSGKKSAAAAQTAGLAPSSISTLLVEGDNRPGLGHAIAKAIGDAGINVSFVIAQVVGRRYSALFGFENAARSGRAREFGRLLRLAQVLWVVITPYGHHQRLVTRPGSPSGRFRASPMIP